MPLEQKRRIGKEATKDIAKWVLIHNVVTDEAWTFASIRDAAKTINVPHPTMLRWLKNPEKQPWNLQPKNLKKRYRTLTNYSFYLWHSALEELKDIE